MPVKKTLQERQTELQTLLKTREGQAELEALANRYYAATGRARYEGTSLITYILVHERERGQISN
jgi:hypothetical protein